MIRHEDESFTSQRYSATSYQFQLTTVSLHSISLSSAVTLKSDYYVKAISVSTVLNAYC
jgi:hypothetical protein